MIHNLLKATIRNLLRNKLFSVINIIGLAAGICCILFIMLFISSELSYEKQFNGSDQIYRIALERKYPDRVRLLASSPVTLVPTIQDNMTEIEGATRLHRMFFQSELSVGIGEQTFNETRFMFADSNYFKVFSHEFISGDPGSALNGLASVVVTESTAKRYFGKTSVLGNLVTLGSTTLAISGVIRDLAPTTHAHFDLLARMELLPNIRSAMDGNHWTAFWVYTYVKIKKETDMHAFSNKVQQLADTYSASAMSSLYGADYKENGHKLNFFLQPLEDIHLYSNLDAEVETNGSIVYIRVLAGVAMLVLIISVVNYVNLSTAMATKRAMEFGVRKTLGSTGRAIRLQIIIESLLICLVSFGISVFVLFALWPSFIQMVGRNLEIMQVLNPAHYIYVLVFLLALTIAAGLYPAVVLSSVEPARVFKGALATGAKRINTRNMLMIIQFAITIAMITGSLAVLRQLNYIGTRRLGFNSDNIIVIKKAQSLGGNYEAFLEKVRSQGGFEKTGGASAMPGTFLGSNVFVDVGNPEVTEVRASMVNFDIDHFEALGYQLVDGRPFSTNFADSASVIINESAANAFGFKNPIGARIRVATNQAELTVVGVVKDYNFYSLHAAIAPLVISKSVAAQINPIAVHTTGKVTPDHITTLAATWKSLTDAPFDYSLFKDDLDRLYRDDKMASQTFNVFTTLTVVMSFIGLVGLTSFLAEQQLKEMSIRRILGAAYVNIFATFSVPFFKLSAMATVFAFAGSYVAIIKWQETYAYKQPPTVSLFASAGAIAILILLATLSLQFARFLRMEPAKVLKEN